MKRKEIHIRDPFVFVENGKYYLLGTTTDDPWGAGSDEMHPKSWTKKKNFWRCIYYGKKGTNI